MLQTLLAPAMVALLLPGELPLDAASLSAKIDTRLAVRQADAKVHVAPVADDAEFFRRVCLDLIGRVPSVAELGDFLDDERPDKRARWANDLLNSPDYAPLSAANSARRWRKLLLSRAGAKSHAIAPKLESWLIGNFRDNKPYDRLVADLLAGPNGQGFYGAYDNKPANIAGATSRLFLGVKLECAQCHNDRSGAPWKQTQFWEFAAFFTDASHGKDADVKRLKIPDTKTWVERRFLDGKRPAPEAPAPGPILLSEWMTRPDNAWFARAAVNRLWHDFFGTGLIEPVDGLAGGDATCSDPELLDELTRQFIANRFDQKFMIRVIVDSQAYQRTSAMTDKSQRDGSQFARAAVRALTPEQIYDSFLTATGFNPQHARSDAASDQEYGGSTTISRFQSHFDDPHDEPVAAHTSIQQALFLMNDRLIDDATSLEGSQTLAAVTKAGSARSAAQQIEELYRAVLSRRPRPEESERCLRYIDRGRPGLDRAVALRDVFWALLNSTEFAVNH